MRYPKGCQTTVMTGDGAVYTGTKNVYAVLVAYKGATEGDQIALRMTGATGTVKVFGVIPTDNGMFLIDCGRFGIEISSCYYSEVAAAAGKIWATVIHS